MNAWTAQLLSFADMIPGYSRKKLFDDIIPLLKEEKFMTQQDMMERYQVSLATIKKWCDEGKIVPSLKVPGGTVRYALSDALIFEKNYRPEIIRKQNKRGK